MKFLDILLESLQSLSANKVRSALTILGIVIGVAAVIAMLGIGNGTKQQITKQIESLGTNLLFVNSGGDAQDPEPLTLRDAEAIQDRSKAPSVSNVAPILQTQVTVAIAGESMNTSLIGVTPAYFEVQDIDIAEGSTILARHVTNYETVVILGSEVAEELFNRTTDLVGEKVRINGQVFTVIGVLESAGGTSFGSQDNRVLVPLSSAQIRLVSRSVPDEVSMLYVQAKDSESVETAMEEVARILRARHRRNLGTDDFEIRSTQSFLETASTITGIMTAFLGGIAGVSLLVGGIGIMNIMLVTVVERTREIGLRKAVGARRLDILIQFLLESLLLSLSGGVIGILFGYAISFLIDRLATMSGTSINPVITLDSILMATLFSLAIGIFFGLYPANRAAKLEPVEALRSE
ncbi:MAG: ABC transporter permease [Anaerolineales bacterium]